MSVLVYISHNSGKLTKGSLEAAIYGAKAAEKMGGVTVHALAMGTVSTDTLATLGQLGVNTVHHVNNATFDALEAGAHAKVVAEAVAAAGANLVVFSHDSTGKALAPRVAARLKAGFVAGAISLPDTNTGFSVRKSVFSGKAFADYSINTDVKVVSVNPNSFPIVRGEGSAEVVDFNTNVTAADFKVKVLETKKESDSVPLPEAELVVSAGRGLKGPENWGMVEELANELGAATACSRPVSDVGWRPHHEHVGQTGITIRPNLYVAIGISGAIQHLAGVNNSKVIVVINKDSEAPFFKEADYGIVGDAFEVVPRLLDSVKKFKASQH